MVPGVGLSCSALKKLQFYILSQPAGLDGWKVQLWLFVF